MIIVVTFIETTLFVWHCPKKLRQVELFSLLCAFLQHNFDRVNATLKMCDYCSDTYRNNPICVSFPKEAKASKALSLSCVFFTRTLWPCKCLLEKCVIIALADDITFSTVLNLILQTDVWLLTGAKTINIFTIVNSTVSL